MAYPWKESRGGCGCLSDQFVSRLKPAHCLLPLHPVATLDLLIKYSYVKFSKEDRPLPSVMSRCAINIGDGVGWEIEVLTRTYGSRDIAEQSWTRLDSYLSEKLIYVHHSFLKVSCFIRCWQE